MNLVCHDYWFRSIYLSTSPTLVLGLSHQGMDRSVLIQRMRREFVVYLRSAASAAASAAFATFSAAFAAAAAAAAAVAFVAASAAAAARASAVAARSRGATGGRPLLFRGGGVYIFYLIKNILGKCFIFFNTERKCR